MGLTCEEAQEKWLRDVGEEYAENLDREGWRGVFEAGWNAAYKQCLLDYDIEDDFDDSMDPEHYDEPSDDFPLSLEYPNEDDSMYMNERLYGEE